MQCRAQFPQTQTGKIYKRKRRVDPEHLVRHCVEIIQHSIQQDPDGTTTNNHEIDLQLLVHKQRSQAQSRKNNEMLL
jgi:hypothetical protein